MEKKIRTNIVDKDNLLNSKTIEILKENAEKKNYGYLIQARSELNVSPNGDKVVECIVGSSGSGYFRTNENYIYSGKEYYVVNSENEIFCRIFGNYRKSKKIYRVELVKKNQIK
ncbi:MAG: hypothetical protein PHS54_01765 [Clostridia bacterium]|nr:hypothetical protein [Clostridia bacterium]